MDAVEKPERRGESERLLARRAAAYGQRLHAGAKATLLVRLAHGRNRRRRRGSNRACHWSRDWRAGRGGGWRSRGGGSRNELVEVGGLLAWATFLDAERCHLKKIDNRRDARAFAALSTFCLRSERFSATPASQLSRTSASPQLKVSRSK